MHARCMIQGDRLTCRSFMLNAVRMEATRWFWVPKLGAEESKKLSCAMQHKILDPHGTPQSAARAYQVSA